VYIHQVLQDPFREGNKIIGDGVENIVKEYAFHKIKKIPKNDTRYNLLLTIPFKEYDHFDDTTVVYIKITHEKEYHLIYTDFTIYLQTLRYSDNDNQVYFIDGSKTLIK
jgi:hypothetical protein